MSTNGNDLTNLNHRNDAVKKNTDINNINKLFPQQNRQENKSNEREIGSANTTISNSSLEEHRADRNNKDKKSGHHNIYINTKDDKDDYKNKKTDNTAQIKSTDGLWKTLNFTQDQYKYLLDIGNEFNDIKLTFESIFKQRDEYIKEQIDELEKSHKAKMDKYDDDLKKLKPLDIEVKARTGDYRNFLIKILNRISFSEEGKAVTDLGDFLLNVEDIKEYSKQILKIANKEGTPVEQKNELIKLSNYLYQTSSLADSIEGTTDAMESVNKIINDYNIKYNTRSLPKVWFDYIIGFLASMFNMFSGEHSYKVYNESFRKLKDCISKLNSQDVEEASRARQDFIHIYEQLELEKTYSVGYDLNEALYSKLKKLKNTIIEEKCNIDNTDLLKKLIKVGGNFDISDVMNNIGTLDREKFEAQMNKFVVDNILPENIEDKEKYSKEFINATPLDKIKDINEDTTKKLEDSWGGRIGKNQSIFSKKKYADDCLIIGVNQKGYNNRFIQDKIDIITQANADCWTAYQNFCKTQIQKYNILISKLNLIQRNTKLSVEPAYRNIISNIKKIFNQEEFKKSLVASQEKDSDLYDAIMDKEELEKYKSVAKDALKNLTDKATNDAKSGKYTAYEEIQQQIKNVKDIETKIKEANDKIKKLKVNNITNSDFTELNRNVKTMDEMELTQKRYNTLINDKLIKLFEAQRPINLDHFNQRGRGMGGGFGYNPYGY